MVKYLSQEVGSERSDELQALLDVKVERMAQHWAEGRDIWSGNTLQGREAEDWLRWQFDGNEPDEEEPLSRDEINEILGLDEFWEEFAPEFILEYQDVSDDSPYFNPRTGQGAHLLPGRPDFGPRQLGKAGLLQRDDDSDARRIRDEVAAVCSGQPQVTPKSDVRLRYAPAGGC